MTYNTILLVVPHAHNPHIILVTSILTSLPSLRVRSLSITFSLTPFKMISFNSIHIPAICMILLFCMPACLLCAYICIYNTFLLIHNWASELFPYLGYRAKCSNEHRHVLPLFVNVKDIIFQ